MNAPLIDRITLAAVCVLLSTLVVQPSAASEAGLKTSRNSLRAGGTDIGVTVFEPAAGARKPPIIVLHGAGGMVFDGPEMRRVSRHLAAEGHPVYMLHYFNSTGTVVAIDSAMQRNFGTWRRTVIEAIAEIQKLRGDTSPVGIYGYSLGGFLALFAASDNPRVGAVVEHAGGVWNEKIDRIRKMPPVLMVHGEQDARVPFQKYAKPLVPELRRRSPKVETRFFPTEAHVFTPAAMQSVRGDAARFFDRWLRKR